MCLGLSLRLLLPIPTVRISSQIRPTARELHETCGSEARFGEREGQGGYQGEHHPDRTHRRTRNNIETVVHEFPEERVLAVIRDAEDNSYYGLKLAV